MAAHYDEIKHSIGLSFSDGSFWCFDCDSYVINSELEAIQRKFSEIKFPSSEKKVIDKENPSEKDLEKNQEENKKDFEKNHDENKKDLEKK